LVILIWDLFTIGRYSPDEMDEESADEMDEMFVRPKNVYPSAQDTFGG